MITYLKDQLERIASQEHREDHLREMLQHIVLVTLSKQGATKERGFMGGTALRICHQTQRYSEDLDFAVLSDTQTDVYSHIEKLIVSLKKQGFDVSFKKKKAGNVQGGMIQWEGLLHELGISGYTTQKIGIKIEVDTNPPLHANTIPYIITTPSLVSLTVHDLPTLFAGKCMAILYRPYIKGRDRYDLMRYLAHKTTPNRDHLTAGSRQAGDEVARTGELLKDRILQRLATTSTSHLLDDVGVFLMNDSERALLDTDLIKTILEQTSFT